MKRLHDRRGQSICCWKPALKNLLLSGGVGKIMDKGAHALACLLQEIVERILALSEFQATKLLTIQLTLYYRPDEVAQLLRVIVRTGRRWAAKDRIEQCAYAGEGIRVPKKEIVRLSRGEKQMTIKSMTIKSMASINGLQALFQSFSSFLYCHYSLSQYCRCTSSELS